jgi:hypothetical protein
MSLPNLPCAIPWIGDGGGDDEISIVFQVYRPGGPGSCGSSAAADSRGSLMPPFGPIGRVGGALLGDRTAVGAAGEITASDAAASLLFGALGAALTKATRSAAMHRPSCRTMAPLRLSHPSTMATTHSSPAAASNFFDSLLGGVGKGR